MSEQRFKKRNNKAQMIENNNKRQPEAAFLLFVNSLNQLEH